MRWRRRPGHPAPAGHRPRDRRPADLQRGRLGGGRPQRRDLQLPRAAGAAASARGTASRRESDTEVIVHLYEEEGADCVRSPAGHVRARALGLEAAATGPRPRPRRQEAALLRAPRRRAELRLGAEGAPAGRRDPAGPRPRGARRLPRPALDPGAAERLRGGAQAPAGLHPGARGRPRPRSSATGGSTTAPPPRSRDEREVAAELREQLRSGGAAALVADVPLGAFLSGGVDSAGRGRGDGGGVEPRRSAPSRSASTQRALRRAARGRGWSPSASAPSTRSSWSSPDAVEILPRIVRHYGEPFADSSAIPSFYLAEMARRHVTVALNGDGGDESFGGYSRYAANLALERAARLPLAARRALAALGRRLPPDGRIESRRSRFGRFAGSARSRGARTSRRLSRAARPGGAREPLCARVPRATRLPGGRGGAIDRAALGGLARRQPARPHARRRRRPLPARRPAGEGRHRDDGPLPGGPLSAARPRADAVRGRAADRR